MLERIPTDRDLEELLGPELSRVWKELCRRVEAAYRMETLWNSGGKNWELEYKYRRGGKTLCTLYGAKNRAGLLIILGQKERDRFEETRALYSGPVQARYDAATTYHDGKWVMFPLEEGAYNEDWMRLLGIKRRPDRKEGEA